MNYNHLKSVFGCRFDDLFQVSEHEIREVMNFVTREREKEEKHRDEWGNWDGQFAENVDELQVPIVDVKWRNKNRWTWEGRGSFCLLITHDVDSLDSRSISDRLRRIFRCESDNRLRLILGLFKRLLPVGRCKPWDFQTWLSCEDKYGYKSTWFVFPDVVGQYASQDCAYRWHDKVHWNPIEKIILEDALLRLMKFGCEVGMHGSYYASINSDMMSEQCCKFKDKLGIENLSHRNHYLRYNPLITPSIHQRAGFKIDSTIGLNRHVGFRSGTSFPHYQWCPINGAVTEVLEIPLVIQDGALLDKSGSVMSYYKARDVCFRIMDCVERVGGCYTILFHPDSQESSCRWDLFECILEESNKRGAWGPTLSEAATVWLDKC